MGNNTSNPYPKMDRENRAKQFMPFAALKGYEDALRLCEKVTVQKIELTEYSKAILDEKAKSIKKGDMVSVVYFSQGEYIKKTGLVGRIDPTCRFIQIVNQKIPFDDILDIQI